VSWHAMRSAERVTSKCISPVRHWFARCRSPKATLTSAPGISPGRMHP
jgi:hypothetical protein